MKYTVDMGPGAMIYIPSFMEIKTLIGGEIHNLASDIKGGT
jgi:hypothetical protein